MTLVANLGQQIRQARKAAGLKLEDVALATGYSLKFLSNLEKHGVQPRTPLVPVLDVIQALGGRITVTFPDDPEHGDG